MLTFTDDSSDEMMQRFQALFEVDNLQILINEQARQQPLPGRLFWHRRNQLRSALEIPHEGYLDDRESHFIDQTADSLAKLLSYFSAINFNLEERLPHIQRFLSQIFEAAYHFLHYRVEGIQEHLDIQGVEKSYKQSQNSIPIHYYSLRGLRLIDQTFSEYRDDRLQEIASYFRRPEVLKSLLVLKRHAPNLFLKKPGADEFLASPRNVYTETGSTIGQPPLLGELSSLLTTIDSILSTYSIGKSELKSLVKHLTVLNRVQALNRISEIVWGVYGCVESIAYLPQTSAAGFSSIDENIHTKSCLTFGLFLSRKIPYTLLFIDAVKIKHAQNILASKSSSPEERTEAKRVLIYARVPWKAFRNLALLLFNANHLQRLEDENLVFDQLEELSNECRALLPTLQSLIKYELFAARGESECFDHENIPSTPELKALQIFSQYGSDVAHLNKLIEVLGSLNYEAVFLPETIFRIFGILGECGKNLSQQLCKMLGESFWEAVGKMRDKLAHASGATYHMEKALRENLNFVRNIKNDLRLLQARAAQLVNGFPRNWQNLKHFYEDPSPSVSAPEIGQGFMELLEYVESPLDEADRVELLATVKTRKTSLEKSRDQVWAIIYQGQSATSVNQSEFFECIDDLTTLSKKQQKLLQEAYKNLRLGKPAKTTDDLKKALLAIKAEDESEVTKEFRSLIKKIKKFTTFESLEKELSKFGLFPEAMAIWEAKHRKVFEKDLKNKKKTADQDWKDTTDKANEKDCIKQAIKNSVDAAIGILKCLDRLAKLTQHYRSNLDVFWQNIELCLAVEHSFVRIRVYVDAIEEALSYLKSFHLLDPRILFLNDLYRILSLKLNRVRLYGNSLAHLHDVTEPDGSTPHWWRLITYNILIGIIDGLPHGVQHLPSLYNEIKVYAERLIRENSKPSIQEFLSTVGFHYQRIPKDGHCLYHAVGLYLGEDQQTLRNRVADYISTHQDEFRELIGAMEEGPQERTLEDYVKDIRVGVEWADNLEIAVLMRIFKRPVIIIGPSGEIRNPDVEDLSEEPIFVYYNGHNHYDALIKSDQVSGNEILAHLKSEPVNEPKSAMRTEILNSFIEHSKTNNSQVSDLTSAEKNVMYGLNLRIRSMQCVYTGQFK